MNKTASSKLAKHLKHIKQSGKNRFAIFDRIRGVAVLLMIASHSIDFFYQGDELVAKLIRWFGATVAFSMFLFVSGAVSYIAYLKHTHDRDEWHSKQAHLFVRIINLLLVYYLIAAAGNFKNILSLQVSQLPIQILKIITFVEVPAYSEFLLPLIVFSLLILLFGKFFKHIASRPVLILTLGMACYVLGAILATNDFSNLLDYYKAIFFGANDWYRFPIFQYAPVFLFGIYFGYLRDKDTFKELFSNIVLCFVIVSFSLFLIISQNWTILIGKPNVYVERWPPSISFLLIGLVFIFTLLMLFQMSRAILKNGFGKGMLVFIGEHALLYYVYHILLLYAYRFTINYKFASLFMVLFLASIILLLCTLLIVFSQRLQTKFSIISKLERRAFFNSELMRNLYKLLVVLSIGGMLLVVNKAVQSPPTANVLQADVEGISINQVVASDDLWWNSDFKHFRRITVKNQDTFNGMQAADLITLQLDHQALVLAQKSLPTADDLRIVYWQNGIFIELPYQITNPNSKSTQITFQLVSSLAPFSEDLNYFLYYNNENLSEQYTNILSLVDLRTAVDYSIILSDEEGGNFTTLLSRKWYLKETNFVAKSQNVLYTVTVENLEEINTKELKAVLVGKDTSSFDLKKVADSQYQLEIPLEQLEVGKYKIHTEIVNTPFKSKSENFFVSYPLLVTWTVDWEGFDVSESYLNAMDQLADSYQMPITTFFNPRIFMASDISPARRTRLVRWAIEGAQSRGDEIALHMHMHLDMINSIEGMTAKTTPSWGGRTNGHDVLTTAYDYTEFKTIVQWALDQFKANGLPRPVSYRAGGWFIDEENLQVLDDLGFQIDSSGREPIIYGANKVPNPWNLSSITKPFHPSIYDQNSSNPPTFDLWELPNNGMDSTNNDYPLLLQKFEDNYQGKPLNELQVLTYLSHPHWFSTYDEADLKELFTHLEKFKYEKDKGPVIFSTLQGAVTEIQN